ncbi:peptidylprolyl isomerase [Desnuesiella massiliensis]|uniref:peptidylprolyl isomerase n=1 Tax=Desnuesiella massiliensis TaxID=1650662 RepID=UPI0006E290AA|nr:peptidylprolyl isomerase [Desnuesiella massiliensis]
MKNVKKIVAAAMLSIFTISFAGCKMIEKTPEAIKKSPVAKVGKETITRGELDEKMAPVIEQLKQQYGNDYEKNDSAKEILMEQKKQLLQSLVDERVLLLKGEELKLVPEQAKLDEEINKKLEEIKSVYGNDAQKFADALKEANLTEEALKGYIKNQVITSKVYDNMVKDVKVDDGQIEKYYNENKDAAFTEKPGAKLFHILVDSEDKAKEVKAKLDKKEDFAKLAKEYGTDGTKDSGGELGFIEYDNAGYDKDFMDAARKLKEGEISGPVKTQFGYHIIKATELRTEPKVKKLEDVKDQIKEKLIDEGNRTAYTKTLDEWKKALGVKTYEKNL